MKVFVAGATGVLGRRAVRDLVAAGHAVTGIARSEEKAALLRSLGATPVRLDLFDAEAARAAVAGHDAVLNLATHVPPPAQATRRAAWHEHERIRSDGARILVDAALAAGATVYVQESLAFVYEDGGDRWLDEDTPLVDGGAAAAVRAAEAEAARFTATGGGRGIALRFGEFYSHDSTHTLALVAMARRGGSMKIGAPDAYAPMIAVDDAARAVVAALDVPAGAYNIVDDEPLTRREIDDALAAAVGGRRLMRPPAAALRLGGEDASIFRLSNRASNARFKAATGWAPRHPSVREGFRSLVRELPGARTPLLQTLALAYLGASALMLGIYATFFPRGFYDDFPLGRGWVAADGPFNEHLVRDFGGLNLGLGLVLVVAAAVGGRVLVRTAALASLLFAVPHLVYHLRHRHALDGIDAVASPATLVVGVAVALAVLALEPQARRPAATGSFSDRTTPGATSSVMASNE
ncbi:MAG TPA: NAD-dependent epimerase/dehydratase family protein [Acidimicrobiales bacterium]|nr:NAD-dependent epimerase/dehydratase family protein [Acidimicrobiales bacterium]